MNARLMAIILACSGLISGCSSVLPDGLMADAPVPSAPERMAALSPPATPPATAPPTIPDALLAPGATITLADVVDIALRTNPVTRASYQRALAAAASLESSRSAYYPRIDLTASLTRSQQSALGGQFDFLQTSYGPAVTLSYLVLDLGGRAAEAEDSRLALLAADWSHDATIHGVILAVQQTFVRYLAAKAQLKAARATVDHAQTALDAATFRHDAGVATIAEVLQARTALSQAQLSVDSLNGQVMALRGALATAMGLPATTPYDVGDLPADLPVTLTTRTVENLVADARTHRPDLAAARMRAAQAQAHVESVRSDGLPQLVASATASRTWYAPSQYADYGDAWSARLLLDVPLFTGFDTRAKVDRARRDAEAAAADADSLEQQVVLDVWTSYYALQTATQLITTSRDLLASAEESEKVALGRYREGVGTILDLLAAQAALANARAQEIQARASWFGALAQLAHDAGIASPTLQAAVEVTGEKTTP